MKKKICNYFASVVLLVLGLLCLLSGTRAEAAFGPYPFEVNNHQSYLDWYATVPPYSHPAYPNEIMLDLQTFALPSSIDRWEEWANPFGNTGNSSHRFVHFDVAALENLNAGRNIRIPDWSYIYYFLAIDTNNRYMSEYIAICIDLMHGDYNLSTGEADLINLSDMVTPAGITRIQEDQQIAYSLAYRDGMQFNNNAVPPAKPFVFSNDRQRLLLFAAQINSWVYYLQYNRYPNLSLKIERENVLPKEGSTAGSKVGTDVDLNPYYAEIEATKTNYKDLSSYFPSFIPKLTMGQTYTLNIPPNQQIFDYQIDTAGSSNLNLINVEFVKTNNNMDTTQIKFTPTAEFNGIKPIVRFKKTLVSPPMGNPDTTYTGVYNRGDQVKNLLILPASLSQTVDVQFEMLVNRTFSFRKVSFGTDIGLQAGFILQRESGGNWADVSSTVYRTDANGNLTFDEAALAALGEGTYRFREVEAASGHLLPTGNEAYSSSFTVGTSAVSPPSVTMSNVSIDRNFSFRKVSSGTNTGLQAGFIIQRENGGNWADVSSTVYRTDANGNLSLNDAALTALGEGTYRFREVEAANGHQLPTGNDAYSESFTVTTTEVTPPSVIMSNIRIDRTFSFRKVSSGTNTGLQAGFILQRENGGNWADVSSTVYRTDANGNLTFDDAALTALGAGTYRFREVEAANGHQLPSGNNAYSGSFTVSATDVTPASVIMSNVRIDRTFSFLKLSESGNNGLPGAQFILQRKSGTAWNDASGTIYTTGADGKISFTESQLNTLGEGTYRFREVQAPADHDLPTGSAIYSPEFTITRETVTPASISMRNTRTNHRLELSKQGADTGDTLWPGAQFIIQGQQADGRWYQMGTQTFTTGANGKLVIDNTTAPGLIKLMLTSPNYTAYRFRETKAPHGRYQDPQYTGSPEADGNPGSKYSVLIDLTTLKTAQQSTTLFYTMVDELLVYQASIQKVDKLGRTLAGAEFSIWDESSPDNKQVNTGNATGLFTWDNLVIGETYVITETKAPDGYGLQSYHYFIYMDKETQLLTIQSSETLTGPRTTLVAGTDFIWNPSTLELFFTVDNEIVRKIPLTGSWDLGLYGYLLLGTLILGFGYTLSNVYKKEGGY